MIAFIKHLMRGGPYGHYWLKQTSTSIWWATGNIPQVPDIVEDMYFGVHPSRVQKGPKKRTKTMDIIATNCLYADIDSKDFTSGKQGAQNHVRAMAIKPSVIVDSGAGYHCYWLFKDPFILDTDLKIEIAKSLQQRWVQFVGGDKAVHDLPRILRLPGTVNYKYDPPRTVRILHANLNRLYTPADLEKALPVLDHSDDDDVLVAVQPPPARPNQLPLQELINRALASEDGAKLRRLWKGDSTGYASDSEADLAFCCILAFWTGGDYDKIDKLFTGSDRMRSKWERDDYRHETLLKALGQVTEYYTDPGDLLMAGAHDEGNAQCVYAQYKNVFAHMDALGWRRFDGTHWAGGLASSLVWLDVTKILKHRVRAAYGLGAAEEARAKEIRRAAKPNRRNIENCMRILQEMLACHLSEFDKSPDHLNVRNGVLNLRTGELARHKHDQRFTYCLPVEYHPEADSSEWESWLLEAVGSRPEVVEYLQKCVGYSLTGHTREEVMFYLFGPARAGKGIFTETLITMLGGEPLGTEVDIKMFMSGRSQDPQGFLVAGLKATRFLAAGESKGKHWMDEARIKHLTGGSWIRCAFKGKTPFNYRPQFKIWLSSNVAPRLDPDDEAAWGRVRVVQFPNSHIEDIDKKLKEQMKRPDMLVAVLAWAVTGAMKWYKLDKRGLQAPTIIEEMTQEARMLVDQIQAWWEENVEVTDDRKSDRVTYTEAFADYQLYCQENGEQPRPRKHWKAALVAKGHDMDHKYQVKYQDGRVSTKRGWVGIRLAGGFQIRIGEEQNND